jgi:hypothetical protein
MPPKMITLLTGVQTAEVSVVPQGANNKRVALSKQESEMPISELIKSLMSTEADGEKNLRDQLAKAGLDAEAVEAGVLQYRLAHGFSDKIGKEHLAMVAKAAGYDLEIKAAPAPREPEIPAALKKQFEAQAEEIRKANERADKNAEDLRKERDLRVRKDLIVECEKAFANVPGLTAEQQADMLMKARGVDAEFEKTLRDQWTATAQAIATSGITKQRGTPGGAGAALEAETKLATLAKEAMAKDSKLSYEQAFRQAMNANPELYQQYLQANPQQH